MVITVINATMHVHVCTCVLLLMNNDTVEHVIFEMNHNGCFKIWLTICQVPVDADSV